MATPLDKPNNHKPEMHLMPQKPMEDLSIENNLHPKEPKNKSPLEPFSLTKQLEIEASTKDVQKACKNIVDYICRRGHYCVDDIIIGEASLNTTNFTKPDKIFLQQQMLKVRDAFNGLKSATKNLGPPDTTSNLERKYKTPIIDMLKEDSSKAERPFNKLTTTIFNEQQLTLESTQELLDDTVDLIRSVNNIHIQLDKLKTADTINWQLEEEKFKQKRIEEEARRKHEEEVRPLVGEKSAIDSLDGLLKGFSQLPEQLHKAEQLTDPALQELPKYIRHTKDGYEPDPLVSEDDLVWCIHPATAIGLLGMIGARAIARKANTVKELNPERPTAEKIGQGLTELSNQVRLLKQQTELLNRYPLGGNPDATYNTNQQVEILRNALPKVMDNLNELEDLPNKQATWNLPTIRASMLRAESSPAMQEVLQAVQALDNERKLLDSQINPPAPKKKNPYDYYQGIYGIPPGYPGSTYSPY